MKQYGRTVNFAEECALLLFHRDPDLAVVVLVLGAVLKPAGVAIQLHIDACGDLVVGVRGQPLGEDLLVQWVRKGSSGVDAERVCQVS